MCRALVVDNCERFIELDVEHTRIDETSAGRIDLLAGELRYGVFHSAIVTRTTPSRGCLRST